MIGRLFFPLFVPAAAFGQIYGDFETSAGRFSLELDFLNSPQAVANFIRLAEGTCVWVDSGDGGIREGVPFYDGLSFYAATPNDGSWARPGIAFGSREEGGGGDPGYVFQDDSRGLGVPARCAYMENREPGGTPIPDATSDWQPNNNGSRIFIALSQLPASVQQHYTFLGEVKAVTSPPGGDGHATVDAISLAAPDSVVIDSVTIRREGVLAESFDEHGQGLPEVDAEPAVLEVLPDEGGGLLLDWEDGEDSVVRFWQSEDLLGWEGAFEGVNYPGRVDSGYVLDGSFVAANPRMFFRGAKVAYESWPSLSRSLNLALIQTNFKDESLGLMPPDQAIQWQFNSAGDGGTWNWVGSSASEVFSVVEFTPAGPFSATLTLDGRGLGAYRFLLHYDRDVFGQTKDPSRMGGWNLTTTNPENELYDAFWIFPRV